MMPATPRSVSVRLSQPMAARCRGGSRCWCVGAGGPKRTSAPAEHAAVVHRPDPGGDRQAAGQAQLSIRGVACQCACVQSQTSPRRRATAASAAAALVCIVRSLTATSAPLVCRRACRKQASSGPSATPVPASSRCPISRPARLASGSISGFGGSCRACQPDRPEDYPGPQGRRSAPRRRPARRLYRRNAGRPRPRPGWSRAAPCRSRWCRRAPRRDRTWGARRTSRTGRGGSHPRSAGRSAGPAHRPAARPRPCRPGHR